MKETAEKPMFQSAEEIDCSVPKTQLPLPVEYSNRRLAEAQSWVKLNRICSLCEPHVWDILNPDGLHA